MSELTPERLREMGRRLKQADPMPAEDFLDLLKETTLTADQLLSLAYMLEGQESVLQSRREQVRLLVQDQAVLKDQVKALTKTKWELIERLEVCQSDDDGDCQIHGWKMAQQAKRIAELEAAINSQQHEVEQILAQAIGGYPRYEDDLVNFPDATSKDGVCVGEHVPESLAMEAARLIASLRQQITALEYEAAHAYVKLKHEGRLKDDGRGVEQLAQAIYRKLLDLDCQHGWRMEALVRCLKHDTAVLAAIREELEKRG